MAPQKAALPEVSIFGDDGQAMPSCVIPDGTVIGIAQTDITNVA
jgi:hypothetical protein